MANERILIECRECHHVVMLAREFGDIQIKFPDRVSEFMTRHFQQCFYGNENGITDVAGLFRLLTETEFVKLGYPASNWESFLD